MKKKVFATLLAVSMIASMVPAAFGLFLGSIFVRFFTADDFRIFSAPPEVAQCIPDACIPGVLCLGRAEVRARDDCLHPDELPVWTFGRQKGGRSLSEADPGADGHRQSVAAVRL